MKDLLDAPKGTYIVTTTDTRAISCTAIYVLEDSVFTSILHQGVDKSEELYDAARATIPAGSILRLSGNRKINSVKLTSGKVMLII